MKKRDLIYAALPAFMLAACTSTGILYPEKQPHSSSSPLETIEVTCRNQQCCLHFWLLLEDPFEQLSGIVKNVDRHGKPALFLIMPDSCLRIIQAKTKAVRRRKSVNNATISYI